MAAQRRSKRESSPLLVCVIHNAISDPDATTFESHVLSAIVHAWYEGHVAAEDAKRRPPYAASEALALLSDETMPMPPFPTVRAVRKLYDETHERFRADVLMPAAVAYAAGLGWKMGHDEGSVCRGCSFRGLLPELGAALRGGTLDLSLVPAVAEPPARSRRRRRTRPA